MDELTREEVESTIIEVLSKVTGNTNITMDQSLLDLEIKSIQVISISALLEDKLGYAPNFRALIGMEKVSEIADFILK